MSADLSQERFCPRCNESTVWDTPGDGILQCTNWPQGEESHCGFTLADPLTDEMAANARARDRQINPREPQLGTRTDPDVTTRRASYELV